MDSKIDLSKIKMKIKEAVYMKKIFFIIIISLMIMTNISFAANQSISAKGIYIASASESLNDAKKHALEEAMRQATEQAGIMVTSYTKNHNMVLTDDEVTTVAAKVVNIHSKRFEVNLVSDSEIKVTAYIDTIINDDSIVNNIEKLKKENELLKSENKQLIKLNNEKSEVLIDIEKIKSDIKAKYEKKVNLFKEKPDMPYGKNITPKQYINYFFIDMGYGDYQMALTDTVMAMDYKNNDEFMALIYYYLAEAGLMKGDNNGYRTAMRFLYLAKRTINTYDITPKSNDIKYNLPKYYDIMYRYMMLYHLEWKIQVFAR